MNAWRSDPGASNLEPLPGIDELLQEFWKIYELELGLHKLYLGVVDGSAMFKFADARLVEIIDDARTRQLDLVGKISTAPTVNVDQLKAKARVLLAFSSSEVGDAQGDLTRSVLQDLIQMPLRAYDVPALAITPTPVMRPAKKRAAASAERLAGPKCQLNEAPSSQR
jgi:hypothetical protein